MDLASHGLVLPELSMDGWYGMDRCYDILAWDSDGLPPSLDAP